MSETNDLTIVYYTANAIPDAFGAFTRERLQEAIRNLPVISISHKPMDFGLNIPVEGIQRSHINIYKQALIGAYKAETKYIALAEDDVLYTTEHFNYRPQPGVFAYNMAVWSIYTWIRPALFSYKNRRNLSQLICERELFIKAMEERFTKYPDVSKIDISKFAEPGKYEELLGVTVQPTEKFYTNIPNIAFSHETALSYLNLGKRKKLGDLRVTSLPFWGSADEIIEYYE